jgi:hypothetical protein
VTAVATEAVRVRTRHVTALLPSFALVAALTAWLTREAWGVGHLLYRDFVAVPDPVLGPAALGSDGQPPRAVPLDAVMAVLDPLVPTQVQQRLMLAGSLFLAGAGAAVLLRHRGQVAMLSGAVAATWNPYVAERLLLGQPPTLLAYSMTPWLVAAVRSRMRPALRVVAVAVAAAPAALTPWGAVLAAVVVLGTALVVVPRDRGRLPLVYAVMALLWCLPWVVPALRYGSGAGDPDGAAAFAVGADSWAGTVGSVVTLGGVWAPAARLSSRQEVLPVACSLLVLGVGVVGALALRREGRVRELAALGLAWLLPTAGVLLLAWDPVLRVYASLQAVPGFALVRDTHRLLALPAVAVALLFGVGMGTLAGVLRRRMTGAVASGDPVESPTRAAGPVVAVPVVAAVVAGISVVLLTAPDLPGRLADSYRPADFPAEWAEVAVAVGGEGAVLSLPWQPFRQAGWAGPHPFLDPLPRAVTSRTVTSRVLTVPRDGATLEVGEDPQQAEAWARGEIDAADLAGLGIGHVVEWKTSPGVLPSSHDGLVPVLRGEHFDVWAVPSAARRAP